MLATEKGASGSPGQWSDNTGWSGSWRFNGLWARQRGYVAWAEAEKNSIGGSTYVADVASTGAGGEQMVVGMDVGSTGRGGGVPHEGYNKDGYNREPRGRVGFSPVSLSLGPWRRPHS